MTPDQAQVQRLVDEHRATIRDAFGSIPAEARDRITLAAMGPDEGFVALMVKDPLARRFAMMAVTIVMGEEMLRVTKGRPQ